MTRRDRSPLRRRRRIVLLVAATAAVSSGLGVVASGWVRSPAQVAADSEPPERGLLTAKAERRRLTSTIVARGLFSEGNRRAFTPRSVAGSAEADLVVTAIHTKVGATVHSGRILLDVSERPVFALPGKFPAYRDMAVGHTGRDVAQLRAGLAALGYGSTDKPGAFGESTAAAVERFYTDRGYAAPAAGGKRMVPRSEVAFLPKLPARVAALKAKVGATVAEPLIEFGLGGITLTARFRPGEEEVIKVGAQVRVDSEVTGYSASAAVTGIGRPKRGSEPSGEQDGETYLPVRVSRDGGWPRELAGQDVRVTLTTPVSDGVVLAVPQAAVSTSPDGRSVVLVTAGGATRAVEVRPGGAAGGWVAVTPVGAPLRPGDTVVTGR